MSVLSNSASQRSLSFRDALKGFMLDNELPFAALLDQELVQSVFAKHRSLFGGVFHTAIVLWAFLSQALRSGKEASCQSAVARISAFLAKTGKKIPDSNTGDYCKARAKLSEVALRELSAQVASRTDQKAREDWKWKGKQVFLVDGFTFQMPDTKENQEAYPQHNAQKPGLGFPIARVTSLLSLATGCVADAAIGPYKGKGTGETSLFKQLFSSLKAGDVVVADRHYCTYWLICYLMKLGVHVCFRKHHARHTDFRKGNRLGKKDHIVTWPRSARPQWMSKEEYAQLPKEIRLREIEYVIEQPGRKQEPFIIVTTMLNETEENTASRDEIANLYGFRWNVELDIRSIKSYMNLGFLRCKSPEMIRREFWITMLAYNLIRSTIALTAHMFNKHPRQISFTSTCQYVLASWHEFKSLTSHEARAAYCQQILHAISSCQVANRPGRFEPRVVKRRRDQYTLMMEPRNELRKRLAAGDNSFE